MSEVLWRTVRVESADEDHEALAQLLWEACNSLVEDEVNKVKVDTRRDAAGNNELPNNVWHKHYSATGGHEIAQETKILRERCSAASPHIWIASISADVTNTRSPGAEPIWRTTGCQ